MNEQECLSKMVAPGTRRPGKFREGVIQIWVTRACDKSCFNCTQGSNLRGNPGMITPRQFEDACLSLKDYFGVVGMFGGNPAIHPKFEELCEIMKATIPYPQRGLWSNNPLGKGRTMAATFNPTVSNLNVHLDKAAYDEFKRDWPACGPVGLHVDSRHSPVYVSQIDLGIPEEQRWQLISECDINQHWSAMIGVFRGELRAYFCEIAGAQAMLKQHDSTYPDTGHKVEPGWWRKPMQEFSEQVRHHCHRCAVPLRGYGELAVSNPTGVEQTSKEYEDIYKPKNTTRLVELATTPEGVKAQTLGRMTDYIGNARR